MFILLLPPALVPGAGLPLRLARNFHSPGHANVKMCLQLFCSYATSSSGSRPGMDGLWSLVGGEVGDGALDPSAWR